MAFLQVVPNKVASEYRGIYRPQQAQLWLNLLLSCSKKQKKRGKKTSRQALIIKTLLLPKLRWKVQTQKKKKKTVLASSIGARYTAVFFPLKEKKDCGEKKNQFNQHPHPPPGKWAVWGSFIFYFYRVGNLFFQIMFHQEISVLPPDSDVLPWCAAFPFLIFK